MNKEYLHFLMEQWLEGRISISEEASLKEYLRQSDNPEQIAQLLEHFMSVENSVINDHTRSTGKAERIAAIVNLDKNQHLPAENLRSAADNDLPAYSAPRVHRSHFFKTSWLRYAAILLLIVGAATFLYIHNRPAKQVTINQPLPDLPPGGNKATLTLADGSIIVLDSASDGSLAKQGSTSILKLNTGSLVYKAEQQVPEGKAMLYNTISTPKGGQYQIVLPDGSKVWLNAASSLRFPAVFAHTERRVEITGEAYLEVAQNARKPFYVTAGSVNIQVLGTSFNINNYANETAVATTLVAGSVRITAYTKTSLITPGQQVQALAGGDLRTIEHVNTGKVIAWKNGLFNFDDATLPEVMKQLERWYNIEVVYEKEIPDLQFGGEMTRDITLKGLLTVLEKTGVHFRLEEGRRLIVLP